MKPCGWALTNLTGDLGEDATWTQTHTQRGDDGGTGTSPVNTLTSDFQTPGLGGNTFLLYVFRALCYSAQQTVGSPLSHLHTSTLHPWGLHSKVTSQVLLWAILPAAGSCASTALMGHCPILPMSKRGTGRPSAGPPSYLWASGPRSPPSPGSRGVRRLPGSSSLSAPGAGCRLRPSQAC